MVWQSPWRKGSSHHFFLIFKNKNKNKKWGKNQLLRKEKCQCQKDHACNARIDHETCLATFEDQRWNRVDRGQHRVSWTWPFAWQVESRVKRYALNWIYLAKHSSEGITKFWRILIAEKGPKEPNKVGASVCGVPAVSAATGMEERQRGGEDSVGLFMRTCWKSACKRSQMIIW